jgi:hypothetical protein
VCDFAYTINGMKITRDTGQMREDTHSDSPVKKNRSSRLFRNILLVFLGLSLCAGTIFVAFFVQLGSMLPDLEDITPVCPSSNPAGFEGIAGVTLPPSASNIMTYCGGWQGWGAYARFEMEPDDLGTFVNTSHIQLPLSESGKPHQLYWSGEEVNDLASYLYGFYQEYEWLEEIIVDTENPDRYIVYFTVLGG